MVYSNLIHYKTNKLVKKTLPKSIIYQKYWSTTLIHKTILFSKFERMFSPAAFVTGLIVHQIMLLSFKLNSCILEKTA